MRSKLYTAVIELAHVLALVPRSAQAAPFVNLNFEQATVPPGTQFFLPAELAFPGWTPRLGNIVQTTVYYNNDGIGEAAVGLYDVPRSSLGLPVFEGTYSAELITGFGTNTRASLAQIGDIPADARSLRLLTQEASGRIVVTVNGGELPLLRLTPGFPSDPAVFGADITAFAGMTNVEVRFVSPIPPNGRIVGFDAVAFSPVPIPEGYLGALAGFVVWIISGRRQRFYRLTRTRRGHVAHTKYHRDKF